MAMRASLAAVEKQAARKTVKRPRVVLIDQSIDQTALQLMLGSHADIRRSGISHVAGLVDPGSRENQWAVVMEAALGNVELAGKPLINGWEQYFAGILVVSAELTAAGQAHLHDHGIRDIIIDDPADAERTALRVGLLLTSRLEEQARQRAMQKEFLLYQSAFNDSVDGQWVVDGQRRFVLVNEAFARRRGFDPEALVGAPSITIGDEKTGGWQEWFYEKIDQGDTQPLLLSRSDAAGKRLDVEVTGSPLEIDNQNFIAGVVREVTDRNVIHEQLESQLVAIKELTAISTAQSENFERQVEKFLHFGLKWFGADDGVVMLLQGEQIEICYAVGEHRESMLGLSAPKRTSQGYEFVRELVASGVENVTEANIDREAKSIPEGIESFIGAPIVVNGQELGALVFSSHSPRQDKYSESQFLVAGMAAEWLAYELRRQQIEASVRNKEQQLRMITDAAQEGIYTVTMDGKVNFANPAAVEMLGFTYEELIGSNSHELFHHSHEDGTTYHYDDCKLRQAVLFGGAPTIGGEVFWRKDGSCIQVDYSVALIADKSEAVVLFRDVTVRNETVRKLREAQQELLRANQRLSELATSDPLTGIANRRVFDQTIAEETGRASRYKTQQISLVLVDVDYFKAYNDRYGHQQGDDCLVKVAQLLEGAVRRPSDLVARYGGEEFVILLPEVAEEDAVKIAESAREAVSSANIEHSASSVGNRVTLSCGVATMNATELQRLGQAELIRRSDEALYHAKAGGRDRTVTDSQCRTQAMLDLTSSAKQSQL